MEITVEKFGIVVEPPALVIVYHTAEKLKRKVIPLRDFTTSSDIDLIANDLQEREDLINVPLIKIKKMLRLLREVLNGKSLKEAVELIKNQFEVKLNEDLNKLSTKELDFQKELMESLFLKNQIKKDDSNFVYDKRVDFTGEKSQSEWDLETDENFWD